MYDAGDDSGIAGDAGGGTPVPWWEGPPPAGFTGQWPPPLPPGGQYGTAPGSIIYPGGSGTPGPTTGGPSPNYDPGAYGNPTPTPPPPTPLPTGGGGTPAPAPPPIIKGPVDQYGPAPTPAPSPNLPNVPNVPAFAPPPAFKYDAFNAPTGQDV